MKVEVAVLGSPSLISLMMIEHCGRKVTLKMKKTTRVRAQELCESRSGRHGLPRP